MTTNREREIIIDREAYIRSREVMEPVEEADVDEVDEAYEGSIGDTGSLSTGDADADEAPSVVWEELFTSEGVRFSFRVPRNQAEAAAFAAGMTISQLRAVSSRYVYYRHYFEALERRAGGGRGWRDAQTVAAVLQLPNGDELEEIIAGLENLDLRQYISGVLRGNDAVMRAALVTVMSRQQQHSASGGDPNIYARLRHLIRGSRALGTDTAEARLQRWEEDERRRQATIREANTHQLDYPLSQQMQSLLQNSGLPERMAGPVAAGNPGPGPRTAAELGHVNTDERIARLEAAVEHVEQLEASVSTSRRLLTAMQQEVANTGMERALHIAILGAISQLVAETRLTRAGAYQAALDAVLTQARELAATIRGINLAAQASDSSGLSRNQGPVRGRDHGHDATPPSGA